MLTNNDYDVYYLGGGYNKGDERNVKYKISKDSVILYMFYQDGVQYIDEVNTSVWYR